MREVRLTFFDTLTVTLSGAQENVAHASRLWSSFGEALPHRDDDNMPEWTGATAAVLDVDVTDLAAGCAEINRAAVAACPLPACHAAVVTLGRGATVIPAVSGAGKSTLAAALCLAGAGYVSDEAWVMDDAGCCVPYPKPVALSGWSLAALGVDPAVTAGEHGPAASREYVIAPDVFGAPVAARTRVTDIVLPRRRPGAAVRLLELPRRDGLATALALGFNHYRDPRGFLRAAAAATRGSRVWCLEYDHPTTGARVLADTLG